MNKILFAVFAIGLALPISNGYAGLSTSGDLSIIGYNSDGDDVISFVIWKDIEALDTINFWDHGLVTDGSFRTSEGFATWTAGTALDAGTVVNLNFTTDVATSGSVSSSGLVLSVSGDQIFAGIDGSFSGDNYTGTVVFGLQMNGEWDANATSSNSSADPGASFANLAIAPEVDNAAYTGPREGLTIEQFQAAVLDAPTNWLSRSNSEISLTSDSFSISAVPEPSSLIYAAIFGLSMIGPRRRR